MMDSKDKIVGEIASHYKEILKLLGEDIEREGLKKTPLRAAKALLEITDGYHRNAEEVITKAIFEHPGSEMIIVKDIEFHSLCEHHILPFFGKISIGYIPDGKIIGLSKIGRLVDVYAKRLQVQEKLTAQICEALETHFPNKGVIVKCEALHLCMKMRGVEKQNCQTVTFAFSGLFKENPQLRKEFRELIQ